MTEVKTRWLNKMTFESKVGDHTIILDADPKVGGNNKGTRPKPLILTSLAGCTGMDVVSLLNKMRVNFKDLEIDVKGELTSEHPKYYHKIHIIYKLKGKDIDRSKVEKAVQLSQDKYCGVLAMIRKAAEISFEIRIEEE
jgi:putative redox protein